MRELDAELRLKLARRGDQQESQELKARILDVIRRSLCWLRRNGAQPLAHVLTTGRLCAVPAPTDVRSGLAHRQAQAPAASAPWPPARCMGPPAMRPCNRCAGFGVPSSECSFTARAVNKRDCGRLFLEGVSRAEIACLRDHFSVGGAGALSPPVAARGDLWSQEAAGRAAVMLLRECLPPLTRSARADALPLPVAASAEGVAALIVALLHELPTPFLPPAVAARLVAAAKGLQRATTPADRAVHMFVTLKCLDDLKPVDGGGSTGKADLHQLLKGLVKALQELSAHAQVWPPPRATQSRLLARA